MPKCDNMGNRCVMGARLRRKVVEDIILASILLRGG